MQTESFTDTLSLPHLEDSADLVNAFDPDHKIIFWNATCERHFNIKKENALGKKLEELLPHIKGDPKLLNLNRALRGQKIHILKEQYNDGKQYYEQKLLPLFNDSGEVYAVLNIVTNLPSAAIK